MSSSSFASSWTEVVHENRKRAELQRAREELRLRRRGYAVEEKASASIPAVLSLAGALTAAAWWRREGRKAHSREWRSLPGISQLLEFIQPGSSQPKRAPAGRSKSSKPRSQLAAPSKAAAARQAAAGGGRAAGGGQARPSSSSSGGSSAAAAAAAAAIARSNGGGGGGGGTSSSGGTAMQQQQQASSSSSSAPGASQQSKAKKKKGKKKK